MAKAKSAGESAYQLACEQYLAAGVSVRAALRRLHRVSISIQCWQGDDIQGFEHSGDALGGGLAVTGNYPGRARTPDELREDFALACSLIPGRHRLNLHASYGEFGPQKVDRDAIGFEHFRGWVDWAKSLGLGLDFNPTFFAHPKAEDGFTLSHPKPSIRQFWVEHGRRCREIAAEMGKSLGKACINNFWIPDGMKDTPADRRQPRNRLTRSLDTIFKTPFSSRYTRDAVEGKLFGLGSESYVVGSHEFYLAYSITRKKLLCLDSGHFHPTEDLADKLSSVLSFMPEILLHVSRGVRWDSDHVVTFNDPLQAIAREIVANHYLDRVRIGLDYFDASINRVAAWVIGTRNLLKALLFAMLEPPGIKKAERAGDFTTRLALQEEAKSLPFGAVWDYYCEMQNVPPGSAWLTKIKNYESRVLSRRS